MPLFTKGDRRILFVHVPKTGGTSVEAMFELAGWTRTLYEIEPRNLEPLVCSPQHWHAPILEAIVDQRAVEATFMVARDPLARFRSEYSFHVRDPGLGRAECVDAWAETVFTMYEKDPFLLDNHLRPQAEFILPQASVYRLEAGLDLIAQDLEDNLHLGLPPGALHLYDSAVDGGLKSRDVEISDDLEALLRQVYAIDYQVFGYS